MRGTDSTGRRRPAAAKSPRSLVIEKLAQSFALYTHYVSSRARRLLEARELTPALERVAASLQRGSRVWLAWADEEKTRFVVAEMAASRGQARSAPAIRLAFYDEDGRHLATGEWTVDPHQRWTLRRAVKPRSDS